MEKKRLALKKLMEAVEHELLRKPNRKTLDHLSLLAGFQDWESFQNAIHGDADGNTNYELYRTFRYPSPGPVITHAPDSRHTAPSQYS